MAHQQMLNTQDKLKRQFHAVEVMERCWCSYRDRQMFQLLKYSICTAEHSLTYEILRKVSPAEADLLKDPVFRPKIKFRFSGTDFPPYIVFKVFMQSDGRGLKYFSGKKVIRPASEAATDACRQMGNRKFYNQMLTDLYQAGTNKIADEVDVTNLKEYMQFLRNTDELPASLGGKDNTWRTLSLEVLPRKNIMYDVMTYLKSGVASSRLIHEIPHLTIAKPITQKNQLDLIQAISNEASNRRPVVKEKMSGRRTKNAKRRVAQMRKMYGLSEETSPICQSATEPLLDNESDEEENWEEEGKFLYEWSQELSSDSLGQVNI